MKDTIISRNNKLVAKFKHSSGRDEDNNYKKNKLAAKSRL